MNEQLQQFARQTLIDGLAQLPEGHQRTFRLMYARKGGARSLEESLSMPIETVVKEIPEDKLDWAMEQVSRSAAKLVRQSLAIGGEK